MGKRDGAERRRPFLAVCNLRDSRPVCVARTFAFAVAFLGLTLVVAASASASGRVAAAGRRAPAFLVATLAGSDVTLRSYAGRPVVLNVFASWCPPCRHELPRIASAARRLGSRVAFLGIDEQEPEQIATSFAREMHLPYPVALDGGQFAASYGARSLPESIFIDAHGIVRAIVHGEISADVLARDLARIAGAGAGGIANRSSKD